MGACWALKGAGSSWACLAQLVGTLEPMDSEEPQNSCLEAHPMGWASSSVHFVGLSCDWERAAGEGLALAFFPSLFSFLSFASSPSFCSPLRR